MPRRAFSPQVERLLHQIAEATARDMSITLGIGTHELEPPIYAALYAAFQQTLPHILALTEPSRRGGRQ